MSLPVVSRAYWNNTFHCRSCKKPRPSILQANSTTCIVCNRKRNQKKVVLSRLLESPLRTKLRKERDIARHKNTPIPLRRARDAFYKVRARRSQSIPTWSNIEDIVPIYEYAYSLELENPSYRYTVKHIHPLSGKEVCGLHTIKNLRIVKSRRSSPSART